MRILLISNYFYVFGGAERVFFNIRDLLLENGHEVVDFAMKSSKNLPSPYAKYFADEIDFSDRKNIFKNIKRGPFVIYNKNAKLRLDQLINDTRPDIALVHNIGRRLSNSIFDALAEKRIPIVHMLHDYKPICSINSFFRDDKICEKCMNHNFLNATIYACNQYSRSASFFDSIEKYYHWTRKTYEKIDAFIAPSRFIKDQLSRGGLEEKKIIVIPHYIDPQIYDPTFTHNDYALFLGRLDNGKGVETLIESFKEMPEKNLKIAGDGPLKENLMTLAAEAKNVEFLGKLEGKNLDNCIKKAKFTIIPSEWYEVFGMVIIESMARGKPVIGSDIAAIHDLIKDGESGFLYKTADKEDLKKKVSQLYDNDELIEKLGKNAAEFAKNEFSKEKYYRSLLEVFEKAKGGK